MDEITTVNQGLSELIPDEWEKAYAFWLMESLRSKHSREAYHRAWLQFQTFTNGKSFSDITTEDVAAWKVRLNKTLEPASVNQKLSALSSFYHFVNDRYRYLREDNPADKVKQFAIKPYGKATLLVDNQDAELLSIIDRSTFEGLRDYTIILMFLTTGVRLAAIADATVDHIRRQGAVTYFHYMGKRAKSQQKRLPAHTATTLTKFLNERGYEPGSLFGMERYQIQYMIVTRCDDVFGKGHGITPHSLRHTAANHASKNGSIQDVRSLLDHESTRITSIYLDHVTNDQGEKMSDLLDKRYA